MSASQLVFLCDDQVRMPENSWIGDLSKVMRNFVGSDGERLECVHIPGLPVDEYNVDVIVKHFFERIETLAGNRRFSVVTDARFGDGSQGGGILLDRIASHAVLGKQFVHGLIYSVQPELGPAAKIDRVRPFARPATTDNVTYQGPIIIRYLLTGHLETLHEVLEYCSALVVALGQWSRVPQGRWKVTEWSLGAGRTRAFSRATSRFFVQVDEHFKASGRTPFGGKGDLLHQVLCPYESLRFASLIDPLRGPAQDTAGGWIRLLFELGAPEAREERIRALQSDMNVFYGEWIEHHGRQLGLVLDSCIKAGPQIEARLRAGVEQEVRIIDSFTKKFSHIEK